MNKKLSCVMIYKSFNPFFHLQQIYNTMKSFKKNLLWLYYVFPCYTSDNECIHSLPSNILQQTINTEYIFISLHKWIFILPQKRYIACVKNTKACKTNVGVSVWRHWERMRERDLILVFYGTIWSLSSTTFTILHIHHE